MKKLISDELNSALCEQIGHEQYNSLLYLHMASFLKNIGMNNLARLFEYQYHEEAKHVEMVCDILTDLNSQVRIPEISAIDIEFKSISDISDTFFDREVETTESLDAIKKLAIDNENPVVEEAMRNMIWLQREEYEKACDFRDKVELMGNDWKSVLLWDLGIGE